MRPEVVLDEWFGDLDELGRSAPEKQRRWFSKDLVFDQYLHTKFGAWVAAAAEGQLNWGDAATAKLAEIILLDQFTRNVYRGSRQMYAADEKALGLCKQLLATAADQQLPFAHRMFSYMPLMHSERIADQRECLRLFEELLATQPDPLKGTIEFTLKFAKDHQRIVERFGRFPHRNEILGRESTPEELEFLKEPGSSF